MGRKAVTAKQQALLAPGGHFDVERAARRGKEASAQEVARKFAIEVARLMETEKCEDILIFDLRGVSNISDFLVLATGTSDRQMRAVADHVEELGQPEGQTPYGVDGYDDGTWIVLDYVDVMAHLFEGDKRSFYDLESLWGDCPRVEWQPA